MRDEARVSFLVDSGSPPGRLQPRISVSQRVHSLNRFLHKKLLKVSRLLERKSEPGDPPVSPYLRNVQNLASLDSTGSRCNYDVKKERGMLRNRRRGQEVESKGSTRTGMAVDIKEWYQHLCRRLVSCHEYFLEVMTSFQR